ncbi:MAG: hypothetical protein GY853_14750 [PVC group bacterium]|nr:hypothetical protein [PVC group bacterium]
MKFSYMSLIKQNVRIELTGNKTITGKLTRVFDDYVVLDDKLTVNTFSILSVISLDVKSKQKNPSN